MELPKPPPTTRQQQQQRQSEPLKCPRCDSTNTKFCYYNNYNKSQPRHFCKACKRHWTKGGLLRNVPVGGGRKNKRLKISNPTTTTRTTTTNKGNAFSIGGEKNVSHVLYQALNRPQSSLQHDNGKTLMGWNYNFKGSTISIPQNQNLQFSLSSLSSNFDTNPSSISTSFQSMNEFNYIENFQTSMEEYSNIMTTRNNMVSLPWQIPTTGSVMDMPNCWNWNDFDILSADLNIPWDDNEIKPKGS